MEEELLKEVKEKIIEVLKKGKIPRVELWGMMKREISIPQCSDGDVKVENLILRSITELKEEGIISSKLENGREFLELKWGIKMENLDEIQQDLQAMVNQIKDNLTLRQAVKKIVQLINNGMQVNFQFENGYASVRMIGKRLDINMPAGLKEINDYTLLEGIPPSYDDLCKILLLHPKVSLLVLSEQNSS